MIHSTDRSGYFGASDTSTMMYKNRSTKKWKNFWDEKLGGAPTFYGNEFTRAGNLWEHSILSAIDKGINFDRQIILNSPRMLLRVNYDGNDDHNIFEIKTHKDDKEFAVTDAYWMQVQVQMFAWNYAHEHGRTDTEFVPVEKLESLTIVSYALKPNEIYDVGWIDEQDAFAGRLPVEESRLVYHPIKYDKSWIKGEYLPVLKELTKALRKGKYPL